MSQKNEKTKIESTSKGDEYSLMVYEKPPLIRLWSHRIRKFLYKLIRYIDETLVIPDDIQHDVVKTTIDCVLYIMDAKSKLRVRLYDLSLACFWLKLQEYGITEISLLKLIKVARKTLNHRITHGKVLRVVSYLRENAFKSNDSLGEIKRNIVMILERMFSDKKFIKKKFGVSSSISYNIIDLKLKIIDSLSECLSKIPADYLIGPPRKVLAAALLYAFLRKYREKGGPKISASDIERYSGVCKFTILRKYKRLQRYADLHIF